MVHSQGRTVALDKGPSLGKGSFGEVFFGFWSGLPCAIKQTSGSSNSIQREIALFRNLSFKNIIQFYAALDHTVHNEERLLIVMEYAENGTLTKAIKGRCLNWEHKKRFSQQILRGLVYMHSRHVLHRDLKSDNVLLTDNMQVAKLCDFGLSKLRHKSLSHTLVTTDGHVGTRRWMAPELFVENPEYTTKTDVFSLGWVLWQMAADSVRPFDSLSEDMAVRMVENGVRETIPGDTPIEMRAPIEGFWKHEAPERPEARAFLDEGTFPEGISEDTVCTIDFTVGTSVADAPIGLDDEALAPVTLQPLLSKSLSSGIEPSTHSQSAVSQVPWLSNPSARTVEAALNIDVDNDVPASPATVASRGGVAQSITISPPLLFTQQHSQHISLSTTSFFGALPPLDKLSTKVVVRDLRKLALMDNMYAQFAFGMMFLKSKGSIQSDFEALFWFKKAAELGHPEAQFYIGEMYERDRRLHKDIGRAVHWYGKAAHQGHRKAMRRLLALFPQKPLCGQDELYHPDDPDASDDGAPGCTGRYLEDRMASIADRLSPHSPCDPDSSDSFTDSDEYRANYSNDPNGGGALGIPQRRSTRAASNGENLPTRSTLSTSSFVLGDLIASSNIGFLYRSQYIKMPCVARKLHISMSQFQQRVIQDEIGLAQRLRHLNLIQFYETYERQGCIYFIIELADKGSLADVIQSGTLLSWPTRFRLADDITRGLQYLHYKDVLHDHLKSTNVLLTKHMDVKLADFGLQALRSASADGTNTSYALSSPALVHGNLRWMAPELLFSERPRYTTKSDMYALGMVMWEMAAMCTLPFRTMSNNHVVAQAIHNGEREQLPEQTPVIYQHWVDLCWEQDPSDRPAAHEVMIVDDGSSERQGATIPDSSWYASTDSPQEHMVSATATLVPEEPSAVQPLTESVSLNRKATLDDVYADSSWRASTDNPQEQGVVYKVSATETLVPEEPRAAQPLTEFVIMNRKATLDDVYAQVSLAGMYETGGSGVPKDNEMAFVWYLRAAQQCHVDAMDRIGDMYAGGRGTSQSNDEAARWRKQVTKLRSNPQSSVDIASYGTSQSAERDPSDNNWLRLTTPKRLAAMGSSVMNVLETSQNRAEASAEIHLEEKGHAGAQVNVGPMYETGRGVEQSDVKAGKWYTKAASQENPNAQNNLGVMYEHGRSGEQSDVEAINWYINAASHENPDREFGLGLMYQHGRRVEKGAFEEAKRYTEAALQGSLNEQHNLECMYETGRGVEQSDVEVFKWYTMAASQEHPNEQNNLGEMCYQGRGVEQSDIEAVKRFTKAALQGNPDGQHNLGSMYEYGRRGVEQSDVEVAKWFTKASIQGNPNAQFNLGLMCMNGQGVEQSHVEADKWLGKAASQGNLDGELILGAMHSDGRGVEQSDFDAVKWLTMAAGQGSSNAQFSLGSMYLDGHGVEQKDVEAVKWFANAASQGHSDAQNRLGF
ncbi:hypothetical protein DFQ27_009474, partial [Actinomortierella ambigua]